VIPVVVTVIPGLIMMFPAMVDMILIEILMIPIVIMVPVPPVVVKFVVMYPMIGWRYRENVIRRKCCNICRRRRNDCPRSPVCSSTIPGISPIPVPKSPGKIDPHSARNHINRLSCAWNNHHFCWLRFDRWRADLFHCGFSHRLGRWRCIDIDVYLRISN
jgi:hypothetical protein